MTSSPGSNGNTVLPNGKNGNGVKDVLPGNEFKWSRQVIYILAFFVVVEAGFGIANITIPAELHALILIITGALIPMMQKMTAS